MTATSTPGPSSLQLELGNPFVCGVGFFGTITGGTGPYELSYKLSPRAGGPVIALGSFVVSSQGAFASPSGFIALLDGVSADFDVSVTVIDATPQQVERENIFVAEVRDPCATVSSASSPALAYPGPFTLAPPSSAAGFEAANPVPQAFDVAAGSSTPSAAVEPPLATTGSDTPLLATLSLVLLAIGGVLMVASRREDPSE